jgi:hypothetical protein
MGSRTTRLALIAAAALLTSPVLAEDAPKPPADKSAFTLFNPTPRQHMRELAADRPDVTENPRTVDAGHYQLELSLVDYTYERSQGETTETLRVAPLNIKAGLTNNVDLQLIFDPYVNARGGPTRHQGHGETELRVKANLLGNDTPGTAVGVMAFVKFPTGSGELSNDHHEGGVMAMAQFDLPGEFHLGTMIEVNLVRDAGDGYGTQLLHTAVLSRKLAGELEGYLEYVGAAYTGAGQTYQAVVGAGLVYGVNDNLQLDVGVNVGISDSADDFNVFVGLTYRI